MTVTERNYRKYLGKLYWSSNRQSLVTIEGLNKTQYGNRWKFDVYYANPEVGQQNRNIQCKRVLQLLKAGNWMPADQYIANQPPLSSTK